MIFTTDFFQPPDRMSFELAQYLMSTAERYGAQLTFDGFTGAGTVTAEPPGHFEVLRMLDENVTSITGITDGHRSFADFFGKGAVLTYDRAKIYSSMCMEGRIW